MRENSNHEGVSGQTGLAGHRQRSPRIDLPNRTAVVVSAARCMYMGVLQNISLGGAFIETDKIHFIGEEVHLRFQLPCLDAAVEVAACVRHPYASRGAGEGVGVQFQAPSQRTAEQLGVCMEYLQSIQVN